MLRAGTLTTRDGRAPSTAPAVDDELVRSIRDALRAEGAEAAVPAWPLADDQLHPPIPSLFTTAHAKHHALAGLEQLQQAPLAALHVGGTANRGRYIAGRIVSEPVSSPFATQFVLDDGRWRVPVRVYRATEAWPKGARIAVLEPRVRPSRGGYVVRVETPADVVWLPGPSSLSRSDGNARVGKGDHAGAVTAYTSALHGTDSPDEQALIRLNRALCYLKLDRPAAAMADAEAALASRKLSTTQRAKAELRASQAAYALGRYTLSSEAAAQDRLEESRTGVYDWRAIASATRPEMGTFVGAVEARAASAARGRSMIASRSMRRGDVLLVCNPLAVGRSLDTDARAVNVATGAFETSAQTDLARRLLQRCLDDSHAHALVEQLYGRGFAAPCEHDGLLGGEIETSTHAVDVGRIEAVVTSNAFRIAGEDRCAVYAAASLVNHACIGNAHPSWFGDVLVLRASCDIEPGEEITTSYISPMLEVEARRRELAAHFDRCDCHRCELERHGDPTARQRLAEVPISADLPSISRAIGRLEATFAEAGLRTSIFPWHLAAMRAQRQAGRRDEARRSAIAALQSLSEASVDSQLPTLLNLDAVLACEAISELTDGVNDSKCVRCSAGSC